MKQNQLYAAYITGTSYGISKNNYNFSKDLFTGTYSGM